MREHEFDSLNMYILLAKQKGNWKQQQQWKEEMSKKLEHVMCRGK